MANYDLIQRHTIVFDRIDNANIESYSLFAQETEADGSKAERLVTTLSNPSIAEPLFVRTKLDASAAPSWSLAHHRVYFSDLYQIEIYVNDSPVDRLLIAYDKQSGSVSTTYEPISPSDTVEVGYYTDALRHVFYTAKPVSFRIMPNLKTDGVAIGTHNYLI